MGAQRALEAIQEAESAKARIYEISGKERGAQCELDDPVIQSLNQGFTHSMMVDEGFMFVASHIDPVLKNKIEKGEYVRFSKLIARDRVEVEEEVRMEMVNKDGKPVWVPASEKDLTTVNSFNRWEQAFRVFSDIYLKVHPQRAPELIQYNHVIYTALLSYSWDNVYKYDRLFHLHMEQNPTRQWSIILQQAWSLCLKDRLAGVQYWVQQGETSKSSDCEGKPCYRFNRGKCTYGVNCKFEHKCLACGKFGHGTHNCRRI